MLYECLCKKSAMLTADVRSRVKPELKREAAPILKAVGLDVNTVIRLFLRCVFETGGLPIVLLQPISTTLAAIKASKAGKVTDARLDDL